MTEKGEVSSGKTRLVIRTSDRRPAPKPHPTPEKPTSQQESSSNAGSKD